MNGRARSALFLMEQLVVITVFAVCASVCVKIFIGSYLMANGARDLNRALAAAKNAAECYRAYGDLKKTAAALGSSPGPDGAPVLVVYYDAAWRVCGGEEAAYALRVEEPDKNAGAPARLSVVKADGAEIVAFPVSARRAKGKSE